MTRDTDLGWGYNLVTTFNNEGPKLATSVGGIKVQKLINEVTAEINLTKTLTISPSQIVVLQAAKNINVD